MRWLTLRKALYCALRPKLWRALRLRTAPSIEHFESMRGRDFRTVVDIGANRGQFSLFARSCFPHARIVAFEPLRAPADLFERLFRDDDQVGLEKIAIAEVSGTAPIHVMTRDDSSSLLQPGELQEQLFDIRSSEITTVPTQRLAGSLDESSIVRPALLKIDVQGTELTVLKGSTELLPLFDAILVECSYVALYSGQALAADVIAWLADHRFVLSGVFNQHTDPKIGPVQADFLFLPSKNHGEEV